jgi:hypothetical protein
MAKIITNNPGKSYKETKGYSRVGGLLKSDAEKATLEKKQARLNAYSPEQTKQATSVEVKNKTVPKQEELNDYGAFKGGQEFKPAKPKFRTPRYRNK